MEMVLLGLAAPAAAGTAGSLLERSLQTVAEPFAALLDAIASTMSSEGDKPEPVTIESLLGNLKSLRGELATEIENALASAGIDLTEPISLRISPTDGRLEVVGDRPQKTLIEAALADSPELANKFTEVAVLQQLVAATNEVNELELSKTIALGDAEQEVLTALFTANDDGATLVFN